MCESLESQRGFIYAMPAVSSVYVLCIIKKKILFKLESRDSLALGKLTS